MEHIILALKELTYIEWGLMVSLFINVRLLYKYAQLDKIVLLIADRSHRDIIKIERDGNYSIAQPLNKSRVPTLTDKHHSPDTECDHAPIVGAGKGIYAGIVYQCRQCSNGIMWNVEHEKYILEPSHIKG